MNKTDSLKIECINLHNNTGLNWKHREQDQYRILGQSVDKIVSIVYKYRNTLDMS